jgi:hypothetical protein
MTLHTIPLKFLIYEENYIFFVISVIASKPTACWYYLSLTNIGISSKCHTKRRGKRLLRTLFRPGWGGGGVRGGAKNSKN